MVKGSFSTDRTLANEGDLSPGSHEIEVTPEPGGKGLSVSFTVPKGQEGHPQLSPATWMCRWCRQGDTNGTSTSHGQLPAVTDSR